ERDAGRIELCGLRIVAAGDVDRLAVGREDQRMDAVLAAAVDAAQELDVVEAVVAVGIADAIQSVGAAALIDHDVQAVESVEQAVRPADIEVDRLRLDRAALPN